MSRSCSVLTAAITIAVLHWLAAAHPARKAALAQEKLVGRPECTRSQKPAGCVGPTPANDNLDSFLLHKADAAAVLTQPFPHGLGTPGCRKSACSRCFWKVGCRNASVADVHTWQAAIADANGAELRRGATCAVVQSSEVWSDLMMASQVDTAADGAAIDSADIVIRVGWDVSRAATLGSRATYRVTAWQPAASRMDGRRLQLIVWCPHIWFVNKCWKGIKRGGTGTPYKVSPNAITELSTSEELAARLAYMLCERTYFFGLLSLPPRERLRTYLAPPIDSAASWQRQEATVALAIYAAKQLPGDFIETGVFTGGTTIAMARVLAAHDESGSRRMYAADSFAGLPPPTRHDSSDGCEARRAQSGARSCAQGAAGEWRSSRAHFDRSLAKEARAVQAKVVVVPGWFNETLPPPQLKRIAFARLDGDLYASTKVALERLFPLLVPGGVVYIDDYGSYAGCSKAVDEYLSAHRLSVKIHKVHETPAKVGSTRGGFEAAWFLKPSVERSVWDLA